jgi:hypothetical protein
MLIRDATGGDYGNILGVVELIRRPDEPVLYAARLETNDEILADGSLAISSQTMYDRLGVPRSEAIAVPEKLRMDIVALYDARGAEAHLGNSSENLAALSLEPTNRLDQRNFCDGLNVGPAFFGVVGVMRQDSGDTTYLHKSLAEIIHTDVRLTAGGGITLRNVGVIGAGYYSDITTSLEVDSYLRSYEQALRENISRLENNTLIDMKFFNTYGRSRHFNSDSVGVFVSARIKLNTRVSKELDAAIKAEIVRLVEASNDTLGLSSSTLIVGLRDKFQEIAHVSFVGFNRVGQQFIERIVSADPAAVPKWEAITYVPEYLNVNVDGRGGILTRSVDVEYI